MFDFTSSKLLILGIVALLVIGPKDLPALLRTLGKYMGIVRRHASEFRAQFDEAMRESELADLKKQVETIQQETEESIRAAEQGVQSELDAARTEVDAAMEPAVAAAEGDTAGTPAALNGASQPHVPETTAASEPAAPDHAPEKSGA